MPADAAMVPTPDLGLAILAADKDLILCDVWGVIHNGVRRFAPAVDALVRFRRRGGTVILVTNAPVPEAQVVRRLDGLGVPRDAYDGVATSGDVTAELIAAAGCPPLFGIGPTDDVAVYGEAARRGPRAPRLVAPERAEMAVCIGLDVTGAAPADYDALLRRLKARGLELICANPDIVVEVGEDLVVCAGAIAERYAAMGGTVVQAGKPFAAIYARAFAMAERVRGPTPRQRVLAIGDAVHTDILGALRQGIAALLISSGIHRAELHPGGRGAPVDGAALRRLLDQHQARPDAVLPALAW